MAHNRWHCSYCTLANLSDEHRCTGCGAPALRNAIDPVSSIAADKFAIDAGVMSAAELARGFDRLSGAMGYASGGLVPMRPESRVRLVSIEGKPKMKWRIAFQRLALLIVAILVACAWLLNLELALQ